uniref:Uncharacterized protein n=1 Tax=Anolis carolinensis TaxID=28377 RepID=A0A803T747_ANOCA
QIFIAPQNWGIQQRGLCDFHDVKVMILGYKASHPQVRSCRQHTRPPLCLENSHLQGLGCKHPSHGDLTGWAKQGVLPLHEVRNITKRRAGKDCFTSAMSPVSTGNMEARSLSFGAPRPAGREEDAQIERHAILDVAPHDEDQALLGHRHFYQANVLPQASGKESIPWAAPMNPWPGFSSLFLCYVP